MRESKNAAKGFVVLLFATLLFYILDPLIASQFAKL
jgi:hypothetical protein